MSNKSLILILSASLGCAVLTSGCAPLIVGGAAAATGMTVSTIVDRRSTGAVVNDSVIEKRVPWEISEALGKSVEHHITVTSYNVRVLLTGEIQTAEAKEIATRVAQSSLDVREVINDLAVMPNADMTQRMSDSTLATKVRTRLIGTENISINQLKVAVDRGIVYIMGILSPQENQIVCQVAAKTSGAKRVVSVATIMTPEQIAQRMRDLQRSQNKQKQNEESY